MNELVEYENNKKEIMEGKRKLEKNEFLRDLSNLMENDEFKNFFNKHMSSWMDIKCTVTYMKLYDEFKKKYKELNDEELDKNLAVYLMCKMMGDKNMCGWTIKTVDNMLESNKLEFFKEFELYMVKNKDRKLLKNS